MKQAIAIFRLVRWQNLLFILLTQCLFYFFVMHPVLSETSYFSHQGAFSKSMLFLLVLASMLIAASGYIINDYFDINIDQVNKPDKMVVEKIITRRQAILLHLVFTISGLILSLVVSIQTSLFVFAGNVVCALLLWVYSTSFKRRLLSGNVMIAVLTAWAIMVLYVALNVYSKEFQQDILIKQALQKVLRFVFVYAGFAFIVSLIREVVKDLEDLEGDRRYRCNTMPIAWGIHTSKVFVGVWIVVLFSVLVMLQLYVLQKGWWLSVFYCILCVITPAAVFSKKLYYANTKQDFADTSKWIKVTMLAGILSMMFIGYYLAG